MPITATGRRGFSDDQPSPTDARFIPHNAPEPAQSVRAVAILEQDPGAHRWERSADGWTAAGGLTYTYQRTRPWAEVGGCWAGTKHDLKDVTVWVEEHPDEAQAGRRRRWTGPGVHRLPVH